MRIKKLVGMLMLLVTTMLMGTIVYGDEYSKNDLVDLLYIDGIDYNSLYNEDEQNIEGVSYEASTNTIMLENCNLTVEDNFIHYQGDIPLHIVIKGTNTISKKVSSEDYSRAINVSGRVDEKSKSSLYITGDGTINFVNFNDLAISQSLGEMQKEDGGIFITGVKINTNGAGIATFNGNINISNATINIDDSNQMLKEEYALSAANGEDNSQYGKIVIENSVIEIKKPCGYGIRCNSLDVSGEYIYAGKSTAEENYVVDTLLMYYDTLAPTELTYNQRELGYILITTEKKNSPTVSITTDKHTSTYIKGKNAATYFATGYTGDKVCSVCGKVISKGRSIAKKKLAKPTVKVGKKKITVKYKRISGATGFQIRYKKSGGKWITKKYKKNKNCSKTFKKLKKGKKYSVQIRVVKDDLYSNWSASKTVKVK